jgi:two-component system, chemotaxis family, CheB/CheR fusion protein
MKRSKDRRDGTAPARGDTNEPAPAGSSKTLPIVGVGASAGGMEAFSELLRHIPSGTGLAFVLIQHLDPTHPSYLSEALARSTSLPVYEIKDGTRVEPDHVYVIPSNADVGIFKGTLALLPRPADERKPHLPIDFFLRALAADSGSQAIGVVLSGTGSDGAEGLRAIKAADGITFAQDPATARFSGMPEAAVGTGAVDFCLPIPELAKELTRIARHPFLFRRDAEKLATPEDDGEVKKVLLLVRGAVGIDFSEYKLASIRRRLARRMALRRLTALEDYVRLLRDEPSEAQALFEDILIHVTSFFRDGHAFEKLKEHAFPQILRHKREGGTIRIWSAGCSTGEEPYSLLIALLEFLAQENASDVPVQLFGTDISESAIEKARAGFYSDGAVRDMSADRLARFFTQEEGGGYRISKSVRERCAFVKHDLATDPPFSKLDLVCCRNVLIYFGGELQRRALATFHFALNEPGFLVLGRAENIADGANLFQVIDKENKIFARTAVKSALRLAPARDALRVEPPIPETRAAAPPDLVRRTETLLLDQYAPPGVIVNGRMEILHFRGRTGPYLEPAPGQPQHDLLKMARQGLAADLRIGVSQARKEKTTVRRSGVRIEQNGSTHVCDVVVIPISSPPQSREDIFAVLFEEPSRPEAPAKREVPGKGRGGEPAREAEIGTDQQRFARLEQELSSTKEYLQSLIEDHQHASEELLSANEELVSSNEELQSLNEELQTAKEELQSTNEELATLNEEMQTRNAELGTINSDLVNILASVEVPIVIVDAGRRIRRFTPKARPILNLLPADVGRPIDDIKPTLAIEHLDQKIAEVIDTVAPHEEEVQGREGRWYRLHIRPYMTVEKKIDGAVLSVVDIDVLKRALGGAEWARDYALATLEAVQVPLVVIEDDLRVVSANGAFERDYGARRDEVTGQDVREVMGGVLDIPALRSALGAVRERSESFQRLEVDCALPGLGRRSLSFSGRAIPVPGGGALTLLAIEDVTERQRGESERVRLLHEAEDAKASAEEANRTKDLFLATLSHELRTPLSSLLLSAQLLSKGQLDEAKLKKTAAAIERAAKAQAQLIDDLLDISRIVTGKLKMELQAVSLASVVRGAIDAIAPSAEKKQVELELRLDESLPPVSGDPVRLQQVVSNLLTNAIKFTPEGGRVTVTVDMAEGLGRIRLIDTGLGIEPDFLPHIFNRFSQEERGQTRTHGGLGLGLAIVRYLVEVHGGTVRAESAGRGKGATFTVSLPLMKKSEQRVLDKGLPSEQIVGNIEGARVLIVEDDPGTRDALTEMLSLSGAVVRSAESAAMAMELFTEFRPEVLVCDIAMPEEDGYSLLGRIRALGSERGGDVPALALTALAGAEDRRQAFEAGFQVHMAKPVDIDRLVTALTMLLKPPRLLSSADHRAPGL